MFENPKNAGADLDGEIAERSPDSGITGSGEIIPILDDFGNQTGPVVRLQRVRSNYLDHEIQENKENREFHENKENVENRETVDYSGDFSVGQICWVWLSGHPLWPGMIAKSPEHDSTPHTHYRSHNNKR